MRIRLDVAYDGAGFSGWAKQPDRRTVQGTLETAIGTILGEPVAVTCAGRTDAGVHARGQVVHFDAGEDTVARLTGRDPEPARTLVRRLNGLLPAEVRVLGGSAVPAEFDARFAALWRRYAYRIADHPAAVDPLCRGQVLTWTRRLDVEAMNHGAAGLLGEHDFAAFCRRRPGASTVRRLLDLTVDRRLDGVIVATVRADAFCHSMVRALVGALIAVGEGRRPVTWPVQVLRARTRDSAVTVVPAHGLTLEEVRYPDPGDLATRTAVTRQVRHAATEAHP